MDNESTMGEHYGLALDVLCKLMEYKGQDGVVEINKLGGVEGICEKLGTSPNQGLGKSVEHRRATFGSNIIVRKATTTYFKLLRNTVCDQIFVILLILAVITIFDIVKLICVVVMVVVTTTIDYYNEKKFKSFLDNAIIKTEVSVIRNAVTSNILVGEIVVGDVCVLDNNSVVPADGILIESDGLKIDESSINGNSGYTNKNPHRDPMILCGSEVVSGNGTIVVTAVGANTRTGIISSLLKKEISKNLHSVSNSELVFFDKENSILRQKLTKLFRRIVCVCLVVAILIFLIMITQFTVRVFVIESNSWRSAYFQRYIQFASISFDIFSTGILEAIPLTFLIVLAITIKKLYKDKNAVLGLHSCETMGNSTSICFDKTGTLTTNRMKVVQSFICECQHTWSSENNSQTLPNNVANLIAENVSINSSPASTVTYTRNNEIIQIGDKTECALLDFIRKINLNFQTIRDMNASQRHIYPFNSDRKLMATLVQIPDGGYRLYVKGASEIVLSKCKFIFGQNGKLMEMTNDLRERLIQDVIKPTTSSRLRTISLAYRDFVTNKTAVHETMLSGEPIWTDEINIIKNLTCLCVLGIEDWIRTDVPDTIKHLKKAGITVRMITGDDINTAISVAEQCGIIDASEETVALDAIDFNRRIRDNDGVIQQYLFDQIYPTLRVVARASPIDKYNLVDGIIKSNLNTTREVVAMVGNGDGDALALMKADVGITFNQFSSDVAKEASNIILTDDNFGGIITTLVWGRNSYDSIAKFLQFVLSLKLTFIVLFFVNCLFINHSILYYEFWMDLFPIILALVPAFFTHNPTNDLHRPHVRNESIISKIMFTNIVGQSTYQLVVIFALIFAELDYSYRYSTIYNTFVLMTLFNMFNATKLHAERNVFDGILKNLPFCLIWIVTSILHFLSMQYEVYLNSLLHFSSMQYKEDVYYQNKNLNLGQWLWCLLFGIGILVWQQLLIFLICERKSKKIVSVV